jgi:uncharacterized protein with NAD-binding domain and iron-sulfur cluster
MTGHTVAVIGGGIGGLSAAQELAERGFPVSVYEANDRFGGKARSIPIDDSPAPLHGEHGFRFFPGFYRHVVDTMDRIPHAGGSVADNLLETEETLLARTDGPESTPSTSTPSTPREWLRALRPQIADDLESGEFRFFAGRLLTLLTACENRRAEAFDETSWWEFIDAEHRSEAYQKQLGHSTQSLVALRPELGSARTIGSIYLQLLRGQLDPSMATERILDGPTSESWIDPWVAYLSELGVDLHPGYRATELGFDGRRVTGVTVDGPGGGETVEADSYVLAVPVEVARDLVTPAMARAAPSLAGIDRLETAWMNGVQFFLAEDLRLARGHGVYQDSPWALTSVSQRQFWDADRFDVGARGDPEIEGVLSVIASDWDTPGILYGKPARECTREEIVEEIWAQLKAHLNRGGRKRLRDDVLVDSFLDPAIVETDTGVENRSPLLINTVGSLKHRPEADTSIPNLVLAADYVRTDSDLACMESANEAARRATNAIIDRSGARADPCRLWSLEEPAVFDPLKRQDRVRYRLGLPHPGEVEKSARGLARRLRA